MNAIVAGALGGLGKGLATAGEIGMRKAADADLENVRAENAQKRAVYLEDWRIKRGDQQRVEGVERRQSAKSGIINQAMDQEFATAKPTDASTWTPEQQAAVDQAKALRRGEMEKDRNYDIRAGLQTGDISPVEAATFERQQQTDAESKSRRERQQDETERHNRAMEGKGGSGNNIDDRTLLNDARQKLIDEQKNLSTLNKNTLWRLNSQKPNMPEWKQRQDIEDRIEDYLQKHEYYQARLAGTDTVPSKSANTVVPSAPAQTSSNTGTIAEPKSKAEYDALPKGANYIKNGVEYIKR